MRLCWVLLLGVLIVTGTVRSNKTSDHDDDNNDDKEGNNGHENGDGNDGRYLVYNFHVYKPCLKTMMFRISCYNHIDHIPGVTE
jgi:hypothetical protein